MSELILPSVVALVLLSARVRRPILIHSLASLPSTRIQVTQFLVGYATLIIFPGPFS